MVTGYALEAEDSDDNTEFESERRLATNFSSVGSNLLPADGTVRACESAYRRQGELPEVGFE
jgi:hypothetical protein